jgi:hypothetical protein
MHKAAGHIVWDWWDNCVSARTSAEQVGCLFLAHTEKFQSLVPLDRGKFLQDVFPTLLSQCATDHRLSMNAIDKLAEAVVCGSNEFALDTLFEAIRILLKPDQWTAAPAEFTAHPLGTGRTFKPGSRRSPN